MLLVTNNPALELVVRTSFSHPSPTLPGASGVKGGFQNVIGARAERDVAPVQRDDAAVIAFLGAGLDVAERCAQHGLAGQAAVKTTAFEIITCPHFPDQGAIGTGKTIRDETVVSQSIAEKLQPDAVAPVPLACQFGKSRVGDGVGELGARYRPSAGFSISCSCSGIHVCVASVQLPQNGAAR